MKYAIMICIITISIWSCEDDMSIESGGTCGVNEALNFDSPMPGQSATYIRFAGEQYGHTDGHERYTYTKDTLVLKILDVQEKDFLLAEYWTKGSANITRTDTTFHWLWVDRDSLFIRKFNENYVFTDFFTAYGLGRFSFGDTLGIPLEVFDEPLAEISGWQMNVTYGENYRQYGINSWTLFEQEYEDLNAIINNTPMQVDGNGTTYIYSSQHGFVRSVTYSWWTRSGIGWDLLPLR